MEMILTQCLVLSAALCTAVVDGHGRLVEPVGRSTMWRFGYSNPNNYNDNQLFCGGAYVQWEQNNGACGICGDNSKASVRENEAPDGKYANGIIVGKYEVGQQMEIKVHLTANHKGWFEYRLCQNNNIAAALTQSCFDEHLLAGPDGVTRFAITSIMEHVMHTIQLPSSLSCSDCVLQWKYNTGNSWGVDPATGKGCMGCGPQEQFYACADIAIGDVAVEVGDTDEPVVVPDGDVDEREELDKTYEYDEAGQCLCKCAQTSTAVMVADKSTVSLGLSMAIMQFIYILFVRYM